MAAKRDSSKDGKARKEAGVMFSALKRDIDQFFHMGKAHFHKKLSNGSSITVTIRTPGLSTEEAQETIRKARGRKSAQEQAVEDIEAGRVPHDKRSCPGCPVH